MGKILFMTDSNASMYEITMHFNYSEQKAGQEMKQKTVSRSFDPKPTVRCRSFQTIPTSKVLWPVFITYQD